MTGGAAFLKKEFQEILSTYKIYVIPGILLFFGLLSPIFAKIAPDLFRSMAKGIEIKIPPPTSLDAWGQFFKNLSQTGILAVIFTSIGLVVEEKNRGTACLLMTKPIPRWSFVVSKFAASAVLIAASTVLAYFACLYYTIVIFKDALFTQSILATILMLAYYLLILALTLFASTVSRSLALAGAVSAGGFILLSVLPLLDPWLAKNSPGAIPSYLGKLVAAHPIPFSDTIPALAGTIGLAAALVAAAAMIFGRQEL